MAVTKARNLILGTRNRALANVRMSEERLGRYDSLDVTKYFGAFEQNIDIDLAAGTVARTPSGTLNLLHHIRSQDPSNCRLISVISRRINATRHRFCVYLGLKLRGSPCRSSLRMAQFHHWVALKKSPLMGFRVSNQSGNIVGAKQGICEHPWWREAKGLVSIPAETMMGKVILTVVLQSHSTRA
jgi:hypothetical protein